MIIKFQSGEAKCCSALRYEEGKESVWFYIEDRSNVLAFPKEDDWQRHYPPLIRDKKHAIVNLVREFCTTAKWIVVKDDVPFEATLPVAHIQYDLKKSSFCGNVARLAELDPDGCRQDFESKLPVI